MRSLLISTLIIILLIGSWIVIYSSISESVEEFNSHLDDMEDKLYNNNWSLAHSIYSSINKKWKNKQKVLLLFLNHKELENINLALEKIEKYIFLKDKTMAFNEVANLRYLINHIKEKESLSFQNIF